MMTSSNSYSQGKLLIQGKSIIFGAWVTYIYFLNKTTAELLWKWNNGNEKQEYYAAGNVGLVSSKNRLYLVMHSFEGSIYRSTSFTLNILKDNNYVLFALNQR